LVEVGHPALSVRRQCELLGLSRSSLYYEPAGETAEDLRLMRLIDEQYTARPFYGSRRMTMGLIERGEEVNRKRVQRLMRIMGLEAIYPSYCQMLWTGLDSGGVLDLDPVDELRPRGHGLKASRSVQGSPSL